MEYTCKRLSINLKRCDSTRSSTGTYTMITRKDGQLPGFGSEDVCKPCYVNLSKCDFGLDSFLRVSKDAVDRQDSDQEDLWAFDDLPTSPEKELDSSEVSSSLDLRTNASRSTIMTMGDMTEEGDVPSIAWNTNSTTVTNTSELGSADELVFDSSETDNSSNTLIAEFDPSVDLEAVGVPSIPDPSLEAVTCKPCSVRIKRMDSCDDKENRRHSNNQDAFDKIECRPCSVRVRKLEYPNTDGGKTTSSVNSQPSSVPTEKKKRNGKDSRQSALTENKCKPCSVSLQPLKDKDITCQSFRPGNRSGSKPGETSFKSARCKPCSVSLLPLNLKKETACPSHVTSENHSDSEAAESTSGSTTDSTSTKKSFSLLEDYLPRLVKVRYLNRPQCPGINFGPPRRRCLDRSANNRGSGAKPGTSGSKKRYYDDVSDDFSEDDISTDMDSDLDQDESDLDHVDQVCALSKKPSKQSLTLPTKKSKTSISAQVKDTESGSGSSTTTEFASPEKSSTSTTGSESKYNCPFCKEEHNMKMAYKFLNVLVGHINKKHKDVSIDQIRSIIQKYTHCGKSQSNDSKKSS